MPHSPHVPNSPHVSHSPSPGLISQIPQTNEPNSHQVASGRPSHKSMTDGSHQLSSKSKEEVRCTTCFLIYNHQFPYLYFRMTLAVWLPTISLPLENTLVLILTCIGTKLTLDLFTTEVCHQDCEFHIFTF